MAIKLFKKENAAIRKISESYSVSNFLTAGYCRNASVAVGNAEKHDETTITNSDRAYYVLEGEININDELIGKFGDVLFIPANTEYHFKGTFKAVIINSPAFNPQNERIKK